MLPKLVFLDLACSTFLARREYHCLGCLEVGQTRAHVVNQGRGNRWLVGEDIGALEELNGLRGTIFGAGVVKGETTGGPSHLDFDLAQGRACTEILGRGSLALFLEVIGDLDEFERQAVGVAEVAPPPTR